MDRGRGGAGHQEKKEWKMSAEWEEDREEEEGERWGWKQTGRSESVTYAGDKTA